MTWQPGWTLAQVEKEVIYAALKFFQGNKVQTARALDISERTLYNKLEIYEGKLNGTETEGSTLQSKPGAGNILQDDGLQSAEGHGEKPTYQPPPEQRMPMRERQEVQEMSSKHAAGVHNGKRSKRA